MDARRQTVVLFDGTCPLCEANVRLCRSLDWFRTVTFVPIAAAGEITRHHGLSTVELLRAIHSIEANGRIESGVDCFRRIGLRIPLLAPLALVLWVPGIHWFGHQIYKGVSRNRYTLSRWLGCRDACALPRTPPAVIDRGSKKE